MLEKLAGEMAIEYLEKSPLGKNLDKALRIYEATQNHICAIINKSDEKDINSIRIGTEVTFAILRKLAGGAKLKQFTSDDFKDITREVSENVILVDNEAYCMYVFGLYQDYINYWVNELDGIASEKVLNSIRALSDELRHETDTFKNNSISEVTYIDDCLWICLEAMIKLLAASVNFVTIWFKNKNDTDNKDYDWVEDLSEVVAMFAFEYGRYVLYSKESMLLDSYIQRQYEIDAELDAKYKEYYEELGCKEKIFNELLENAFSPNFRESYIASIRLAQETGVNESEILDSIDKIDDFFTR